MNQQQQPDNRDFSTISPSALSLLYLKALTHIPYAKQAIEVLRNNLPETGLTDTLGFWLRVLHFESRYWSIDQLMTGLGITNILEISSGFSFRGLAAIKDPAIHYIDTDLPDVVEQKRKLINVLDPTALSNNRFKMMALNALHEADFNAAVDLLPPGKVLIVNEGLMMYLNPDEKKQLCNIIHKILQKRGGYWITADVYVKFKDGAVKVPMNDKLQQFFEQHHIEDNKFDSFEAAENFFVSNGFLIDKQAERDSSKLTTLDKVVNRSRPEQLQALSKSGKIQATWRLGSIG